MMALHLYAYTSQYVGEDLSHDLTEIQAVSTKNNSRDMLTGALIVHGSRFIQILEGSEPAIEALMQRLNLDRRHEGLTILFRQPILRRSFAGWSMVCRRIQSDTEVSVDELLLLQRAYQDTFQLNARDFVHFIYTLCEIS